MHKRPGKGMEEGSPKARHASKDKGGEKEEEGDDRNKDNCAESSTAKRGLDAEERKSSVE